MSTDNPNCPSTNLNECMPTEEYVMYYHIKNHNVNDSFFKLNNGKYEYMGKYTGFSTRPTYKSQGRIEIELSKNNSIFIACKARFLSDLGWVITENLES